MNIDTSLLAKPQETIEEHTRNVIEVTQLLLDKNEDILEKLSKDLDGDFFLHADNRTEELRDFIIEMARYHDYGKVNPAFQTHMKKRHVSKEERQHAKFSFYLWLAPQLENEVLTENMLRQRAVMSYAVLVGHHGGLKDVYEGMVEDKELKHIRNFVGRMVEWGVLDTSELKRVLKFVNQVRKEVEGDTMHASHSVFLTAIKFIFSVLVDSDSIASSEISTRHYKEVVDSFFGKNIGFTSFHWKFQASAIMKNVEASSLNENNNFSSCSSMDDLRVLLNKKTSSSFEEGVDIYVLEAPVGSGKTVSGLSLADIIAKKKKKKKIMSIFPLNSVQTQYVHTVTEDLGIDEEIVSVVNSESMFGLTSGKDKEEQPLRLMPEVLWLFERNSFSKEFIITSHVRFFNVLASVHRKDALGFLGLKNSVVVIDEFQNYPPKYWFGIWDELLKISQYLNVTWVFTTGTFPVSEHQLLEKYQGRIKKVLSPEENQELFTHPFIKGRCEIVEMRLEEYGEAKEAAHDIIEDILLKSREGHTQFLVCSTFVKQTKEIFSLLSERFGEEYHCYFLCGRHSSSYKKELMKQIFDHNKNREDKVMLVTTKTVECGMDFDFDIGYKEYDRFDSSEQLSGRVNRSNKREKGAMMLFRLKRNRLTHEKLYQAADIGDGFYQTLELLREKSFVALFDRLYSFNKINVDSEVETYNFYHRRSSFKKYEKQMNIIEENDFSKDILVVNHEEEEELINILSDFPIPETYADAKMQSMRVRNEVEPYEITVTTKWLSEASNVDLIEKECRGLTYYMTSTNEGKEELFETYEINGVRSYLERNRAEDYVEFY